MVYVETLGGGLSIRGRLLALFWCKTAKLKGGGVVVEKVLIYVVFFGCCVVIVGLFCSLVFDPVVVFNIF